MGFFTATKQVGRKKMKSVFRTKKTKAELIRGARKGISIRRVKKSTAERLARKEIKRRGMKRRFINAPRSKKPIVGFRIR